MRTDRVLTGLVAVVLLHLGVTFAHGSAHTSEGISLSPAEFAFVVAVIEIGPLAGLLWMRVNKGSGALLIAVTMAAAFVFGLVKHFVIPGADRVDYVRGPSHMLFETTAVLLAITELAAAALGLAFYRRRENL
jgi:uncharacterized membrane protein AbrB (regulator of aidB expression)